MKAHGISPRRARVVLFALALASTYCASCKEGGGSTATPPAAGAASEAERAKAVVEDRAPAPPRLEGVALADAVAVAAHAAGKSAEGARLAALAGDLRTKLWRLDRADGDGREALELFAASAAASPDIEVACEAERRRAVLAGELARDASASYRELYLASRRHQGRLAATVDAGAASVSKCLAAIDMALAAAVAYRPSGEAMRALERDGDTAADLARRGAPNDGAASGPKPRAGEAGASAPTGAVPSPIASASTASPTGDVVVSPKEDAVGKDPVKIVSVDPVSGDSAARVVVRLTGPATFQAGALDAEPGGKNPRVYVDIARATSKGIAKEIDAKGLLRRVRLGAHSGGTRVVLDVAGLSSRRVFYLPDPFRIVIDVGTRAPAASAAAATGPREIRRIALDPGHGGNDSGAVGPTGLREKDVTLDIAHRAAPLFAHELGIETLLTRDSDTYVPLDLRAARANAFHADLFVSIHCNASDNGAARGVQTFILDEAKDVDGVAAKVAMRENAQRGREDAVAISAVLSNLNVAEMSARSRHVADLLQRSTLGSLLPRYPDTKDQGVKTAGFFVLAGADMPAVLFETAFISNAEDEGRLATADYRQKLADAIVNAVRAYKAGK
jgi:N-acetylmuramoyl-L-alanine amidase